MSNKFSSYKNQMFICCQMKIVMKRAKDPWKTKIYALFAVITLKMAL